MTDKQTSTLQSYVDQVCCRLIQLSEVLKLT